MSQLHSQFDYKCNQFSPYREDLMYSVSYDEDGKEFTSFKPVDYEKIRKDNGIVSDWNLNNLLKAGISPNFTIHTGLNSRMEGAAIVSEANATAEAILSEIEPKNE